MDEQNKNLILATALSFAVILVWFLLFPPPEQVETELPTEAAGQELVPDAGAVADGLAPLVDTTAGTGAEVAPAVSDAATEALSEAARIAIDTPRYTGSISTLGGRIDDLQLKDYRETLDPESELVTMFAPLGEADFPYYALHGWIALGGIAPEAVPGDLTEWTATAGQTLTVDSPVTMTWDNGQGQVFTKTISVDEDYLFTIRQSIENTSDTAISLRPYGEVRRHGLPDSNPFFILHEGVVRMTDGELEEVNYDDIADTDREDAELEVAGNGWVGFTDKYWMATLIPAPGTAFTSAINASGELYRAGAVQAAVSIPAGESATIDSQLFAGAKEWEAIRAYQNEDGIEGFIDSIDWGWFFFLTKPIFAVLHWLNGVIGNMGWSIIALTLLIKAVLLPLAFKSYVSMAKMRELQPEMEKLKERAGDNREELQKGMMELYKKNKVNPASGCLPILLQIPIFFSLYKVIFVTIELRHAPWIGWIRDLSAPDPSSIFNLYGLLPWAAPEPGTILATIFIGILPLLLGVSMWLQQKLNPAPTDPTQQMVFAWMPWIFMFMLGSFASGLVIYWIANNVITFTQQYLIMRSQGYKPDILGNIRGSGKAAGTGDKK